jgi:hypothetical protein
MEEKQKNCCEPKPDSIELAIVAVLCSVRKRGEKSISTETLKKYLRIMLSNLHEDKLTMRCLISLQRE